MKRPGRLPKPQKPSPTLETLATIYEGSAESQSIGPVFVHSDLPLAPYSNSESLWSLTDEEKEEFQNEEIGHIDSHTLDTWSSMLQRRRRVNKRDFVTICLVTLILGAVIAFGSLGLLFGSESESSPPSPVNPELDQPPSNASGVQTPSPTFTETSLTKSPTNTEWTAEPSVSLTYLPTIRPTQNDKPTDAPPLGVLLSPPQLPTASQNPSSTSEPTQSPVIRLPHDDTECPRDPRRSKIFNDVKMVPQGPQVSLNDTKMEETMYRVSVEQTFHDFCDFEESLSVRFKCPIQARLEQQVAMASCVQEGKSQIRCAFEPSIASTFVDHMQTWKMSDMPVTCLGTQRALIATVEPREASCSLFGIVKTRVNAESVKPCVIPNAQSETTCLQGHLSHVTFQGGECWQEEECRSTGLDPDCLITKTTASLLLEPTDECIVPNIRDEGEDCLWNEQCASGVCYDHVCWSGPFCNGDACSAREHCQSSHCEDGVCQENPKDEYP